MIDHHGPMAHMLASIRRNTKAESRALHARLQGDRDTDLVQTLRRSAELLAEQAMMLAEGCATGFTGPDLDPDIETLSPDDRADYDELGKLATKLNAIADRIRIDT